MTPGAEDAGSAASDEAPPPDDVLPTPIRAATPVRKNHTGEEKDVSTTPAARLRAALDRVVAEILELTRGIGVWRLERDLGVAVILAGADFYFEKRSAPQQAAQMKVKRRYETFSAIVRVLLRAAPDTLLSQWKEADERFREAWVELGTNHALSPDRKRNRHPVGSPPPGPSRTCALRLPAAPATSRGTRGFMGTIWSPSPRWVDSTTDTSERRCDERTRERQQLGSSSR